MTPNKVIENVDSVRPNSYSEETKLNWISDLDGMVKQLVFQEDDFIPYEYSTDMDKELLIKAPYENLYQLYVETQIDYYNREYGNYNNSVTMFNERYDHYKKAYIRKHRAKG